LTGIITRLIIEFAGHQVLQLFHIFSYIIHSKQMRYLFAVLTVGFLYFCLSKIRLTDSIALLVLPVAATFIAGIVIKTYAKNKNQTLTDLGWGLLWGSLSAIILGLVFTVLFFISVQ